MGRADEPFTGGASPAILTSMDEQTLQRRFIAWLLDGLMVIGLGMWFGNLGWLASIAYWLARDGLFDGQSIGKRLMGLKVIVQPTQTRCTLRESAIRNVLWIVPVLNVLMAVSGLCALLTRPPERHWGDRLADTQVVPA